MTLGRFELVGIPPSPRGVPQIEVSFQIDPDGVVNVSAQDLGTGQSQGIELAVSSGLTSEEVERLVDEAQRHAAQDSETRALTESRNKAEGLIYSTEKMLDEFAEDITAEDLDRVQGALALAREHLKNDQRSDLTAAIDELSAVTFEVTERLYACLDEASQPQSEDPT